VFIEHSDDPKFLNQASNAKQAGERAIERFENVAGHAGRDRVRTRFDPGLTRAGIVSVSSVTTIPADPTKVGHAEGISVLLS
jgi:hypothetical protein